MGQHSSVAIQRNPVQGTLVALHVHSQSWRMQSTLGFEMNQVWACSNSSFYSEYLVPSGMVFWDHFAQNIQYRPAFVFLMSFVKLPFCCVQVC